MYYLNSRYYDAEVGRFINADAFIGASGGIVGYNMFAYCNNNPTAFADPTGNAKEYNPYDGSLEGLILWYHELYWYRKDNFDFVGDIDVGFYDSCYGGFVTIEHFLSAMENVDFKATPVLLKRYEDYKVAIGENDCSSNGYYASIDSQLGNLTLQVGIIVTAEDGFAVTVSPGITSSPSLGFGASIGSSNARNNAAFSGTTVYLGRSLDVGSFSGTFSIESSLDNKYIYNSIGVMWGISFYANPRPEQASISYTFVFDLN